MTVRKVEDPAAEAPAGYKGYYLVGPPAEVRQAIETTAALEWFSRPHPYGNEVLVRVRERTQVLAEPATPPAAVRWWRDPRKVTIAGFAGGGVVTAAGVLVWLLALAVAAAVSWVAANWAVIVAILVVAFVGFIMLTRVGAGGGGRCTGLHCGGCRDH
jgi:hypothetical protein